MDVVTAGQIAFAAASAVWSYFSNQADDADRERYRNDILRAIKRMQDELLDTMIELAVIDLRGELQGFRLTYQAYDPDPSDPVEEERLRSLIDDSADTVGRLGVGLDSVATLPDLALETWAVYVPLLYLRAQAMTERQLTYGSSEIADILPSIDEAIPRLKLLLSHLRVVSDGRFGKITCRPIPDSQDHRVCWYRMGAGQIICGSLRDPGGVEKCNRARRRHMDTAYSAFEGVREITAAIEQLEQTRDALDSFSVLHILSNKGVEVGDLVLQDGRIHRTGPLRMEAAVRRDPGEWFV